ncbi:MAG TPA: FHA domain-containing protein [Planctomycetaceae bacterium]|nr:FHA domain-containing protein [Planctomycetaceae bacterium]
MPVLKLNGQQFVLQPGPNRLGGGTTADVFVDGAQDVLAIVDLSDDGRATIRGNGSAAIRVNGTSLAQPSPLIHGDKVEVSGHELFFADDVKQGGSTQFVSSADVAAIAAAKRSGPARGTLNTGGRLVSLVDGKEYPIPDTGITIGRDASAEIVVAQTAVSRRHAQVIPGGGGYVVNDLSTNGVFVNGEKAASGQTLSRADVIRVGTEEFRFYADLAPIGKAAPAPVAAAPAAPPAPAKPAVPAGGESTGRVPTLPPPAPAQVNPPAPPPPPPTTAKPAPPAAAPKPAAPAAAKTPTPPARAVPPATPAPAAPPVTASKGIPSWIGIVIVIAVAAVGAYFIMASKN